MRTLRVTLLASVFAVSCGPADAPRTQAEAPAAREAGAAAGSVADVASRPAVSEANLLEQESFWPYQLTLVEPWQPSGSERTLPSGTPGVLIRVEDSGLARIDFSNLGVHDVPVARTDLVRRANEVASGERRKFGPNLLVAVGRRLMSSLGTGPEAFEDLLESKLVLCIFADADAPSLPKLARAISQLERRYDFQPMLFPQGEFEDADVLARLQEIGWGLPFMPSRYAGPYSESLIDPSVALPAVSLSTPEGRLILEMPWRPEASTDLGEALEKTLGHGGARSIAASGAEGGD